MQSGELQAGRSVVVMLGLVAVEVIGAGYLIADAAGAFTLPAGHSPGGYWLVALAFVGLLVIPFLCFALASVRSGLPFAWLLAPACAGFFVAYTFSYDHGADGYVLRYADEHPGLVTWAIALGIGALAVAWLTKVAPRIGIACTGLGAIATLLPMIGIALAGH